MSKTLAKKSLSFVLRLKSRLTNFVYYKILSNKKSLLLIGGDDYPELRSTIIHKYSSNWKIASLSNTPTSNTDLHFQLERFDMEEYRRIEEEVKGFTKLFDSVVVLPSRKKDVNLGDEEVLKHFDSTGNNHKYNKIAEGLLAYRLASRMLTPNGTFILTGSQFAFFNKTNDQNLKISPISTIETSVNSCITSVAGERDHLDVNSCSLMVLTDDIDLGEEEEQKQIGELIKAWSEGNQLGYPGSFAKIKKKDKVCFPEFF